jgi:cell wall-associated NlpC family hydrolase
VTERATGRHRASHKSSTSLATLTGSLSVVGDYVGSARRTGVIIAMSSGLVASMALPASALPATPPEASGPVTASIPAVPASGGSSFFTVPEGGLLALPPDLAFNDVETVAAPVAATVDFDHSSFTVLTPQTGFAPKTTPSTPSTPSSTKRFTLDAGTSTASTSSTSSARRAAQQTTATTSNASTAGVSAAGSSVLGIAFRYKGVPYRWGGNTPSGFDCSGFTKYVFGQLGKSLPRTVAEQRNAVRLIPRSQAAPGDLVIFGSSHIGIYLGGNQMIDAPRRGTVVQIREIYSSAVAFGRV